MHRTLLISMALGLAAGSGPEVRAAGEDSLADRLLDRPGWALLAEGEPRRARQWFARETSRHPEAPSPRMGYGLAAAATHHRRSAAWAVRRTVQLTPEVFPTLRAVGRSEALRPLLWKLVRSHERELMDRPEDRDTAFMLAALHYLLGEEAAARSVMRHARRYGDFSDSAANLRRLIHGGFERSADALSLPPLPGEEPEASPDEPERSSSKRKPDPQPLGSQASSSASASDAPSTAEPGAPSNQQEETSQREDAQQKERPEQATPDRERLSAETAPLEPRLKSVAVVEERALDPNPGPSSQDADSSVSDSDSSSSSDRDLPSPDLGKVREGLLAASRSLNRFTEKLRRAIERDSSGPGEKAQPDAREGTGR